MSNEKDEFDELFKLGDEFKELLGLTREEIHDVIRDNQTFEEFLDSEEDRILERLKETGKRLKERFNITEEDIEKAIKEIRQEENN